MPRPLTQWFWNLTTYNSFAIHLKRVASVVISFYFLTRGPVTVQMYHCPYHSFHWIFPDQPIFQVLYRKSNSKSCLMHSKFNRHFFFPSVRVNSERITNAFECKASAILTGGAHLKKHTLDDLKWAIVSALKIATVFYP